jgi:pyrroline-5-carboxylate reductase
LIRTLFSVSIQKLLVEVGDRYMKLLFIGAGNMAQAIISGLTAKKVVEPSDISIYEINGKTRDTVCRQFGVESVGSLGKNLNTFDCVILAVKPQVFKKFGTDKAMSALADTMESDQLVISIMAGISVSHIQNFFAERVPVIRCMPNTPALIGQSMSVLSASSDASDEHLDTAATIFASIGEVEIMDESSMDAVTGLSGSGPAYVYMFIESLVQGGIQCGLPMPVAKKLAVQTVLGSAMMIEEDIPIEQLRHNVTSPGGTTIEAISVLERRGFRSAVIDAVRASCNRSKELSGGK